MKNSQQEVRNAVQLIADTIGKSRGYAELAKAGLNLPTTMRNIIYDMFVAEFNSNNYPLNDNIAIAELIIRKYVQELDKNGFVEFDKKETSASFEALKSVVGLLKDDITDDQMNEMLNDK